MKIFNSRTQVERSVLTERQCWENTQYSTRKCLDFIEITTLVKDDVLKETICCTSHKLGAELGKIHDRACRRIKSNRTLIKLSNRKDCLQVLRAKKRLKNLDGIAFNLPRDNKIFITKLFVAITGGCGTSLNALRVITKSIIFTLTMELSVTDLEKARGRAPNLFFAITCFFAIALKNYKLCNLKLN